MATIVHPYSELTQGRWLKGNLHAHTTRSDGKCEPQAVIDAYAALGHDFLMISDHDILSPESFYASLDAKGLVLLPGNEVSANGPHLLHVGADRLVPAHPQRQQVSTTCSPRAGSSSPTTPTGRRPSTTPPSRNCGNGSAKLPNFD